MAQTDVLITQRPVPDNEVGEFRGIFDGAPDFMLEEDTAPDALDVSRQYRSSAERRAEATVRTRIGEDLHDSAIQQLFASVIRLNATARRLDDEEQAANLRQVSAVLTDVISELRELVAGLRCQTTRSLREEIDDVVSFIVESSGVRCSIEIDDESAIDHALAFAAGSDIMVNLCMAARELVSNSVRHGQATAVWVRLERSGSCLVLTVDDDGVGLWGPAHVGNGLLNLQARASRLGGDFELRPRTGGGATARWRVPLPVREDMA